ncbi:MAG: carboxypeptidase regulatory-like domain-containing protein [Bryobacteraceae bacterium]|jgi:hypothetical protein
MLRIPLLLVLGIVLLSTAAYSQGTASIVGTVTDPSGAGVPSAKITITSTETGLIRSTETNTTGSYSARELPIGRYNVQVEAAGFKTYVQTGITLNVNDTVRADAPLQVGAMKESVTVEATALAIQSDTNEVSQTITETMVSELATNGRNVIQLAMLVPGAAASIPDFDSPMAQNQNRTISYGGQRPDHNNWLINGGEAYDRGGGGILIVSPSQDALQEFKVMTSNFAADLGQSSGGMITMATKSGTKQFHGGAWEYLRNNALDANTFFANLNNRPKPELRYNMFGFNLGGPVPIGHEKKTFFFYNMEWRRLVNGGELNALAVPAGPRIGDFSGLATIKVPITTDPVAIAKFAQYGLTPGQAFPNNIIPSGLLDASAKAVLAAGIFPVGNTASGRYYASTPNRTIYREEAVRMDHQFSEKLNLMGSLIWDNGIQSQSPPLWAGGTYDTVGSTMNVPSWSGVVHLTHAISPSLLNEISWNFNGNNISITDIGPYQKPAGYTAQDFFPSANTDNKLPAINIGSPYNISMTPGWWPWYNTWRSWQWKDDLSWSHGRHNMKFGGSYMYTHKDQELQLNIGGSVTFSSSATGNGFADFMLGYASSYSQPNIMDYVHISTKNYNLYAMDDWRVSNRLTVNLGLRWEGIPHAYDSTGRASNFYPNLYSSAQAATFLPSGALDTNGPGFTTVPGIVFSTKPFYMNGIGIAGRNGIPAGLVNNHWDTFAPRVGFAYDLTGHQKTILRAGAGIFYERLAGNEEYNMGTNVPFSFQPNPSNVYWENPATNYTTGVTASTPYFPAGMTTIASQYKVPTSLQWSLGIQQQLRENAVLTVSYVGNSNYHQSEGRNINAIDPNNTAVRMGVCGGTCGYTGTALNPNLYRPYQGWGTIAPLEMVGNSNYNSLQASLRATAWKNLTFSSAFTWSHTFDIIDGELFSNISNPFNARWDYGPAGWDRRLISVTSFVYSVPAFQHATGITKTVLGGWQISGMALFESGTPFSIGGGPDNLGLGGATSNRANIVAAVTYPKTRFQWFSTSSFQRPAALQWGTAARNDVVGPGRNTWNMALYKAFQFAERARFEFRVETFNTFNHTQLTNPSSGVTNGDFGQISGTYNPRNLELGAKLQF